MAASHEKQPNIFYRHFDLPANYPVIGLLGDSWQCGHTAVTRMHFHNCLEIGYLYSGSCTIYMDEGEIRVQAPCIVLAPPNMPHANQVDEGDICGWKWIYVDPMQLLPQLSPRTANALRQYQNTLCTDNCVLTRAEHPRLWGLLETIIDEMERQQTRHQQVVRELFCALFLMLLRISPAEEGSRPSAGARLGILAPAITYIAEHYMNDLSIEELSAQCHISTSHFRRLFKQMLGWAPLDYLQMIRIERACALLYNDEFSVTEVGIQVGYASPSSFSRQFRRIYNVSPSQWRQKMRSEENPIVTAYFRSLPPTVMQFYPQD